jgi:hypothetical protein
MIPMWFNPLAGLLAGLALLGVVYLTMPPTPQNQRTHHLVRFLVAVLAVGVIVLFGLRLGVTS